MTGPAPAPTTWAAVVYHYPGADVRRPKDLDDFYSQIRAMQRAYLADPKRGYSLGYNFAISPAGDVVEVRGLDTRNAANNGVRSLSGVANYNLPTVSVLFWVSGQDGATAAQLAAASRLHVDIERHVGGRLLRVEGHGDKDATPCPGDGIRAQLTVLAELVDQVRNPPTPSEEDDMPKLRVVAASDPKNDAERAWHILGPDQITWCRNVKQLANGRTDGWFLNATDVPDQTYTVQEIREMYDAMGQGTRPPGF